MFSFHFSTPNPPTKAQSLSQQTEANTEEELEGIMNRLRAMNPSQRTIHIDAINRLLDGSANLIDVQLPKTAQKTRGRPKGALNKPWTTTSKPSAFEKLEKKRKAKDQEEEKKKRENIAEEAK
ncbi:hypothetical protein PCANC_05774 [Puccinia coronata f. sp. avenae]|uniref:Uncharacterized protein n=1 Tax=Puccinia coronata f. sp. avenae TaxID=200324 RepID=A0A2N5VSJ5_9BASI|nr:hypothetical protein PCANC_05774 [Puccinia coronata f. sp. avenae]